jgi:hypothetical protein
MALFAREFYLVAVCNMEPSKNILTLSLMVSLFLLFERLLISIAIKHMQIALAKDKAKNND